MRVVFVVCLMIVACCLLLVVYRVVFVVWLFDAGCLHVVFLLIVGRLLICV